MQNYCESIYMGRIILITIAIIGLCTTAYMFSRNGYETAKYDVISQEGKFEIRKYKPMLLVSTTMNSNDSRNGSAFGRLFRYITGSNEEGQKISMTSPVFSSNEDGNYRMSFLIPKDIANNGAPKPTGKDVKIESMDGGKFAVYRYSGYQNARSIAEAEQKLAEWVKDQKLNTVGEMISAGYDPPYTPSALRRNEVLIRLKK